MLSKLSLNQLKNEENIYPITYVTKRNGRVEPVSFDKILHRIRNLAYECNPVLRYVNISEICKLVTQRIVQNITTQELDIFTASICSDKSSENPEYLILASRILISNHHKNTITNKTFTNLINMINDHYVKENKPFFRESFINFINEHKQLINDKIDYSRDYLLTYFGFCTLQNKYLITINKDPVTKELYNIGSEKWIVERPQDLFMRVACSLYENNIDRALEVYDEISLQYYIHATPTLYNSGTINNQLASCFLLGTPEDSIEGIYNSLKKCAIISKYAGGIGINIHDIRSKNSFIYGTNGTSNGIIPMLRVFNNTARYVDQGGGKRKGSIAIYLEPWHADIESFLMLRKNNGDPEERCRDLFFGLWIPDLFMIRIMRQEKWSLFDPNVTKNLANFYGEEFDKLYLKYEQEQKYVKQIDAIDLWNKVLQSQIESGQPYLLFKDSCNFKSNQKNLGTIKSSNLCTEIIQYSSKDEIAVCNLASINLKLCVTETRPFDLKTIKNISIYSIDNCPYCKLAIQFIKRKLLRSISLSNENDISDNKEVLNIIKLNTDEEKKKLKHLLDIPENEKVSFPKISITNNNDDITWIMSYNDLIQNYNYHVDYSRLEKVTRSVTRNLNRIIDISFYPLEECERSNKLHRPIGIGVQGLADLFFILKIPFISDEARIINHQIFECIYHSALDESCNMAKERTELFQQIEHILRNKYKHLKDIPNHFYELGYHENLPEKDETLIFLLKKLQFNVKYDMHKNGKYSSYHESPISKGIFQFELSEEFFKYRKNKYGIDSILNERQFTFLRDFNVLREKILLHGLRNSLLIAPMPTASTSQILGNNECFEPITSNYYTRRTLSGDFFIINSYLIQDLIDLEIYSRKTKDNIMINKGSVKNLNIPEELKSIYLTAYEISKKCIIDLAADRGKFICQSQSMNLHVSNISLANLNKIHFMSFLRGLKTGIYYLHTQPVSEAGNFTILNDNQCQSCSG